MERLIFLQFLVALSMSLAGVCFFIWGTLSGLFKDIESIKYDMLRRELGSAAGGAHERE
jgi:cbb3-type cytochrome oxidase maturation protein